MFLPDFPTRNVVRLLSSPQSESMREAVTKVTTCQGRLTQVWSDVNPHLSD